MCFVRRALSFSEMPHPTPPQIPVPDELRALTCARMLAFLDVNRGIVVCLTCHEQNKKYMELFHPSCILQNCHFIYNNNIWARDCEFCNQPVVRARRLSSCDICISSIHTYLAHIARVDRNANEGPDFIINLGPDPVPMKILSVHEIDVATGPTQ